MSLTYEEPPAIIRCPACRREREVTARQRRRIDNGDHGQHCFWCRTGTSRQASDAHLRFWLTWAGVAIPRGMKPRAYIAEFGIPGELRELATEMWPAV